MATASTGAVLPQCGHTRVTEGGVHTVSSVGIKPRQNSDTTSPCLPSRITLKRHSRTEWTTLHRASSSSAGPAQCVETQANTSSAVACIRRSAISATIRVSSVYNLARLPHRPAKISSKLSRKLQPCSAVHDLVGARTREHFLNQVQMT